MEQLGHVVVIGASLAGLAAAGALRSRAERVTIFEARPKPVGGASIAPQGPAPHLLLGGGRDALEALFPGLASELLARGATEATPATRRLWYHGYRARPSGAAPASPLCSRALLESTLRARVADMPNIGTLVAEVDGLLASDGKIRGVRLADGQRLEADLVIDCAGRGSRACEWLRAADIEPPRLEMVGVGVRYVSMTCARRPGDADGDSMIFVQNTPPAGRRFGLAFAIEQDRWHVLLGGYFADAPPRDDAGYLQFAASLGAPDIAQLISGRERQGEFFSFAFPASQRRCYGELRRPPAGFAPLGDSVASFNPVFGQGMTSAALQALALCENLEHAKSPQMLVRRQISDAERITGAAWQFSTGPDFRYSQTVGRRAPLGGLTSAYADWALRAAITDPVVSTALSVATGQLRSPATLFAPQIAWRVLAARAARRRPDSQSRIARALVDG